MTRKWPPYREPKPTGDAKDEQVLKNRHMADADACDELLAMLIRVHPEHERPVRRK